MSVVFIICVGALIGIVGYFISIALPEIKRLANRNENRPDVIKKNVREYVHH